MPVGLACLCLNRPIEGLCRSGWGPQERFLLTVGSTRSEVCLEQHHFSQKQDVAEGKDAGLWGPQVRGVGQGFTASSMRVSPKTDTSSQVSEVICGAGLLWAVHAGLGIPWPLHHRTLGSTSRRTRKRQPCATDGSGQGKPVPENRGPGLTPAAAAEPPGCGAERAECPFSSGVEALGAQQEPP